MKLEKPDLRQPKTLILPAVGALLLILLFCLVFCRSNNEPKGTETVSTAPAFPETKLGEDEVEIELRRFTRWMTPEEIDAYIRILAGTSEKSFWDQGYWIIAAEGRWHEGMHQFRIAYDKSPPDGEFSWQYKINQTQIDFSKSIDQFLKAGYILMHTQSFTRPDDTKRYQGVWHKVSESAAAAKNEPYDEKKETVKQGADAAPVLRSATPIAKPEEPLSKFNKQNFRESSGN